MTAPEAPKPFAGDGYALPDGLTLSPMTPDEADTAAAICAAIEPWSGYPISKADLTAFFAKTEPDAPRFTLRARSAFAGVLVVRRNWMRGPYVQVLMIAPGFQGRGLGSLLLQWVERQARLSHDRNLWIAVTTTNTGAQRCYERLGFAPVAELDGLVHDGKTERLMRKRLA